MAYSRRKVGGFSFSFNPANGLDDDTKRMLLGPSMNVSGVNLGRSIYKWAMQAIDRYNRNNPVPEVPEIPNAPTRADAQRKADRMRKALSVSRHKTLLTSETQAMESGAMQENSTQRRTLLG